ncbi:SDR family NAD(P)-dependent oxidoreductase [Pseudonocardia pini]|uniref:SDR family NAD(P)-dependent oxidoreductase n=1 Tax=Pseudonocardia pini TaxID=2758030 RepID=UPI0015F07099|nr:SDR family oxidoreductase [Pseudonocardia pini]
MTGDGAAVVTGAAQGIGRAEAERLVAAGLHVVLNDVDAELLEKTVAELGGPTVARAVPGDAARPETARQLVAAATEDGRFLECVVANAAVLRTGMIWDLDDADLADVVSVTLGGTFWLAREAARYWRDRVRGGAEVRPAALVLTTSRAAVLANPGQTTYAAAKAGVAVMAQTLARELRAFGVRVNAIAPRAYTKMMRDGVGDFDPAALEEWSPAHVGRFVAFLCGPAAGDLTGQLFVVHGWHISVVRTWEVSEAVDVDWSAGEQDVATRVRGLFGDTPTAIPDFQVDDLPLAQPGSPSPFAVETAGPR